MKCPFCGAKVSKKDLACNICKKSIKEMHSLKKQQEQEDLVEDINDLSTRLNASMLGAKAMVFKRDRQD